MREIVATAFGFLLAAGTVSAQQYLTVTVAGGGLPPTPAPATSTALGYTGAVAVAADGAVYFTATNCVFRVDTSGVLTRVAGSSALPGYSGDGGLATSAQLKFATVSSNQEPTPLTGLAVDAAGNIYISDVYDYVVRKVTAATGVITTVAGTGMSTAGPLGDGGPATGAMLAPMGLALDGSGDLYIADLASNSIRKVTAATGIITTVAGNGNGDVRLYSGDGGPATSAQLNDPVGVVVDGSGNLYISDSGNNVIRKVTAATGIITTVAGNGSLLGGSSGDGGPATSAQLSLPGALAVDGSGSLYIVDSVGQLLRKVTAASGIITTLVGSGGGFLGIGGLGLDGSGNLYVADAYHSAIRKLAAATGIMTTVAGNGLAPASSGDGGPATSAQISAPRGVAVDGSGNLYITDPYGRVVRTVTAATGIITRVAGNGTSGYSGDRGPATSAQFEFPGAVAADSSGNIYIGDAWSYVIRKVVAATGVITTVAGTGSQGYSGDGGPAASAQLGGVGVAVDTAGNLYIADTYNNVIRKVAAATGTITTVAGNGTAGYSGDGGPAIGAQLWGPQGVAVDVSGNLYIADYYNYAIREVSAATGIMTTLTSTLRPFDPTGGPPFGPTFVAVDGSGNVFFPYGRSGSIAKVVAATGIVTAVGGPAAGVALDAAGDVYASDGANNVVLMLVPAATHAVLSVTLAHSPTFARGQTDAPYAVVVSNTAGAGPSSGTVTVAETVPAGLALASMSGAGWSCSGNTCTRNDVLGPSASYPPIAVTVNVAADAPSQVTNQVAVSGGGSATSSAADLTTMAAPPAAPVLVSPANGATGALVAPVLVWSASALAASYDVHFGSSSTPPLVTNTAGTTYAPGTLSAGTTYYWQITARNGSGFTASGTWSFTTGDGSAGLRFTPVVPCRVADTREAPGPFGGPTMSAGSSRSFAIPQGPCGIPTTAQAYSLNVTVVPAGPLAYLTLWPTGQPQPIVSTLNSWGGSVVSNAAIVPAGAFGAVSVFVSDPTDVILDINGYFDDYSGPISYAFYPATPCRIADTRGPTGQFGGPYMHGGQTRDFPIPLSGCGLPATARGYSLNVTVVPGGYLGYLSAGPTGQAPFIASTLNSWTGKVVANAALVPAGTNESISIYVSDATEVILDGNGYFAAPGSAGALSFYPITPCRVADTRWPGGPFGGPEMAAFSTRSFPIPASACNVPTTAAAYSLNVTVVPDGPLGFLTAWATGSPQPNVSTLNSWDGTVVANAAIVPAGTNGAISIYVAPTNNSSSPTHVILDINGYFAP